MDKISAIIVAVLTSLLLQSYSNAHPVTKPSKPPALSIPSINPSDFLLELGWVNYTLHDTQHVNILGVIGDDFTPTASNTNSGLVGLGYYPLKHSFEHYDLSFGINAFYLGRVLTSGTVTQEDFAVNLAYSYALTNWPIYVAAKARAFFLKTNPII